MPRSWLLGGRMHFHQWKRREFITLLGGAAAWSCVAVPQGAKKRPVVGILGQGTPAQRKGVRWIQSFLDGMRKLSWIEGRSMNGLLGEERRLSWMAEHAPNAAGASYPDRHGASPAVGTFCDKQRRAAIVPRKALQNQNDKNCVGRNPVSLLKTSSRSKERRAARWTS